MTWRMNRFRHVGNSLFWCRFLFRLFATRLVHHTVLVLPSLNNLKISIIFLIWLNALANRKKIGWKLLSFLVTFSYYLCTDRAMIKIKTRLFFIQKKRNSVIVGLNFVGKKVIRLGYGIYLFLPVYHTARRSISFASKRTKNEV